MQEVETMTITQFQSTLPARGSDGYKAVVCRGAEISIHTPRKGERPFPSFRTVAAVRFQSTLPARGSDAEAKLSSK